MKRNSVLKLFLFLMAGFLMGCASADDTITLNIGEVVTYETAKETVSTTQKKLEVSHKHEVQLVDGSRFELNSTHLTEEGVASLEQIAALVQSYPTAPVIIVGHTCSIGEESYNQWLSQQRAESVRDILQQKYGITNPIDIEGKGSSEPRESNETREGRQANRRVEVYIFK